MLKSPLFWKMSTLLGCILLLSIPLMLVRQLIVERADYRSDVVDALESSTSGSQETGRTADCHSGDRDANAG